MARVPYVSEADLSDQDRPLVARNLNIQRALANNPIAFRQFAHIGMWFRFESSLDPRLRELAILATGYAQASGYEFSHHLKISKDYGVTDDDIRAVIIECSGGESFLPAIEKAVISAANQLSIDGVISQDTWDTMASEMDHPRLVELVLLISFYNHFARVMSALQIDIEAEYAVLLTPYAPPSGFGSWR